MIFIFLGMVKHSQGIMLSGGCRTHVQAAAQSSTRMSESELPGDDFGYLEGDLGHVWEPSAR